MHRSTRESLSFLVLVLAIAGAIFLFFFTYLSQPSSAAPTQHVTVIEKADRNPGTIRVTYVERITSRANYVEFNSGATVYIRTCSRPNMWNCVDPTTGRVGLREHGVQMIVRPSRNVRLG